MRIKILDQTWTFEKVKSHDAHLMADGDVCLGTTWPVPQEMYVSEELNSDRAIRTIRHELCHAYIAATQTSTPEKWDEEVVCDLVGIYGGQIAQQAMEIYLELFRGSCMVIDSHSGAIAGHYGYFVPKDSEDEKSV